MTPDGKHRTTAEQFADTVNGLEVLEKDWGMQFDITLEDITSKYCVGGRITKDGMVFVDGSSVRIKDRRVTVKA